MGFAAKGVSVRIYDKAPRLSPTAGAGIRIGPNGQAVLQSLGLTSKMDKILHPLDTWLMYDSKDRQLAKTDLSGFNVKYGLPVAGVLRAELLRVIAESLPDGQPRSRLSHISDSLYLSKHVVGVVQSNQEVTVQFSDGSRDSADFLLGADGLRSTVRSFIFPNHKVSTSFANREAWYGVIDQHLDLAPFADKTFLQILGKGFLFEWFRVGRPSDGSTRSVFAVLRTAGGQGSFGADETWTQDGMKAFLLNLNCSNAMKHAVEASTRLTRIGLFNRAPLSTRWHKDRVVVLGDASHAVLPYAGQGANLAIEDGLVLSELMTDPSLTANDALEKFHMRRYHRVARMVELSRVLGNFELTTTWWGDIARKFFFKALHGGGFIARQLEEEIALHCPVKLKGV